MSAKKLNPRLPALSDIKRMYASYFEFGDILTINFNTEPQVAVSVAAPGKLSGLYWRVNFDTEEITGLEIHGFYESFLDRNPEAKVFAELAAMQEGVLTKNPERESSSKPSGEKLNDMLAFEMIADDARQFAHAV